MRVSIVGVGKLGLPVALAWASKGHDVVGYDISPAPAEIVRTRKYPHLEPGAQTLLDTGTDVRIVDSVSEAVAHGDIVFIAVETPHKPEYEGITRMPKERADFSYSALRSAFVDVARAAEGQQKRTVVVIISTALPGTCEREILPLMNEFVSLVYSPLFIAQSTVVEDALNPEFVLLGVDLDSGSARAVNLVRDFFSSMHAPEKLRFMSVASAEATKVLYNTAISSKVVLANAWMEICHKTGANVDDVSDALAKATDRIISPRYMRGGMGEGGSCHPRDAMALSWLAEQIDLSFDLGGMLMQARENQTEWLATLAIEESKRDGLPIAVLGKAYKRGTNLTVGSPAVLLANILAEKGFNVEQWDPFVDGSNETSAFLFKSQHVYVITTAHDFFYTMCAYPTGSVIVDPWGKMPDMNGVKVIRVGRTDRAHEHAEAKILDGLKR